MLPSLFAALVSASVPFLAPPLLPQASGAAVVGVHVERTRLSAHNFSESPRWLVLRNEACKAVRILPPQSGVEWEFAESCLWGVDVQVVDVDRGQLHMSPAVALLEVLDLGGHTLWVGDDSVCWLESFGELAPVQGSEGALPAFFKHEAQRKNKDLGPLHVPVIRPGDRPDGDRPPHIEPKPLPPI